jgi:hypothetical protein
MFTKGNFSKLMFVLISGLIGFHLIFTQYIFSIRPPKPNITDNYIFKLDNHGSFIFVTQLEYWLYFGSLILPIILLCLTAGIGLIFIMKVSR